MATLNIDHDDLYKALAERIGMDAVKNELQNLSFAELEPDAYNTIQARLNFLRGQGADVIEEVKAELVRICREAGVTVAQVAIHLHVAPGLAHHPHGRPLHLLTSGGAQQQGGGSGHGNGMVSGELTRADPRFRGPGRA